MAKGVLLSAPELDVTTINDFTPGTYNFSRTIDPVGNSVKYPPVFPMQPQGSCSQSFRCYAQPGVGLVPFPGYTQWQIATNGSNLYTAICSLASLGSQIYGDKESLVFSEISYTGIGGAGSTFQIITLTGGQAITVGTTVYTHTHPTDVGMVLNNFAEFFTLSGSSLYNLSAVTIDPTIVVANQLTWVGAPQWNGAGNHATGTIATVGGATPVTAAQVFVSNQSRLGVIVPNLLENGNLQSAFYVSDIQAMTNIGANGPFFFAPSNSNLIGAWGSVSTGEYVFIFQGTGAVIVYGDLFAPQAVINLPGVIGTGRAIGPAVSSPIGLVYLTDYDGVYVWNGSNTSQKISLQIPDDSFFRQQYVGDLTPTFSSIPCLTHHDTWNNWIMFANNWMYDCVTNSWWQVQDPAITNFQVHCASKQTSRYFYSTDGYSMMPNRALNGYVWDKTNPSSNYVWTSNPVGQPGGITSLQRIEIVASNPTSTPSTITVTPTSPPHQSLYGNQNSPQPVIFTIPPLTSNYRASLSCGYTDYNVCVKVEANNSAFNSAPTLHEISLGLDRRPTAVL